ncbi:MAG: tetratricopeptide repeat protein, partial [Candidatus Omnitrophica bacterium]|nr:tetratricopeptide repeat protein [Candidatus Omnitrophota bacterium]
RELRANLLEEIRSASPESGVAVFLELQEGLESAQREEWDQAVDLWLKGIETYPIDWETQEWIERIAEGLLNAGHRIEADVAKNASKESLRPLRLYREALQKSQKGEENEAKRMFRDLLQSPQTPNGIQRLCRAESVLLNHTDPDSMETVLRALGVARAETMDTILAKVESASHTESVASDLESIACHRFNRADVREAVRLWEFTVHEFPSAQEVAARSYDRLIGLHWTRLKAIRAILASFPNNPTNDFFSPMERNSEAKARKELEETLAQSEIFAASATYSSEALLPLMTSIYRIQANLGRTNRPRHLFEMHARKASPDQRSELAERVQPFRPEEAIAILRIDSGSEEFETPADQRQNLLSLYEESEQYDRAAEVARELALAASGTPYAKEAWFKTAWLEYKSKDFQQSKETLEDLVKSQEPGTPEHCETSRLLGLSDYQLGEYEEARSRFDAALESGYLQKTEREEMEILYAYSFLYRQDYSNARLHLESILADNPSRITERRLRQLVQQLDNRN